MSDEQQPYQRPWSTYCPDCGQSLVIVTRATEKPRHDAPLVYSCVPCKKSWSVAPTRLDCATVDFDNGVR